MIFEQPRSPINMQKDGEISAGIVDYHVRGRKEGEGLRGTCKPKNDNLTKIAFLRRCRLFVIALAATRAVPQHVLASSRMSLA